MRNRGVLVKRSSCLVFFFQNDVLHCKNYLTGREFEASPVLVPILASLNKWSTLREVEQSLHEYSGASVQRGLRQLIAHTAVVIRGSAQSRREDAVACWETWGVEARFFHFATRDIHSRPF